MKRSRDRLTEIEGRDGYSRETRATQKERNEGKRR